MAKATTYEVKIAGFAVPAADHQWHLTIGVAAPLQLLEVPATTAARILDKNLGKEVTVQLGPVTIERAILLGIAPHDEPQKRYLVLTDVRWYWTRGWFAMDLNVRRRIGDRRLVGDGDAPQDAIAVQDVQYASWSLNAGEPWRWDAVLPQVMRMATKALNGRPEIKWTEDESSLEVEAKVLLETVTDAELPLGIARALGSVPGRSLYVDVKGVVHVCDRVPGAERAVVKKLPKELLGHGSLVWVNAAASRPKRWRIKFTPEYEVRCTFAQTGLFSTTDDDQPYLENVLEVPDRTLEVPPVGRRGQRTVASGSYLTHDEAYAAWGAPEDNPLRPPQLSDNVVREGFAGDLLTADYVLMSSPDGSPVWAARIQAVRKSYRRLFRVNPKFWARVRSASAVRAAVWDVETGTRAPSPVYSNYSRRAARHWNEADNTVMALNVTDSYPTSGLIAAARPCGARVNLLDEDQGVFEIVWDERVTGGDTLAIFPSPMVELPDLDPEKHPELCMRDLAQCVLVPRTEWSLATILSCVPAAPNDTRRFYEVEVSLGEALETLGLRSDELVKGGSLGPDQEDRCGLTNARFAWEDDSNTSQLIIAGFGGKDTLISADPKDANLTPQSLEPINLASELIPSARAVAAADLINKLDHYEGQLAVPSDSGLSPIGSISTVTHRVTREAAVTVLQARGSVPPMNALDLLPASVRKVLAREVQR